MCLQKNKNMDISVIEIKKILGVYSSKAQAVATQRFFKTGRGEYGEGDIFIGVKASDIRRVARMYSGISLLQIKQLLHSNIHEERMCALVILVEQFSRSDLFRRKQIYEFYFSNTKYINNWDLVDISAHKILGVYLFELPKIEAKKVLQKLAISKDLWERRIAIIATAFFIKNNRFDEIFNLALILLKDEHDLIHKAVGWMLREVGNQNREEEEKFLQKHYKQMPRTMLRYAIEKFPEDLRQQYLKGVI